jgi:hypothetical protein
MDRKGDLRWEGRRIQIEKKKWEMMGACGLGWAAQQDGDDAKSRCECSI